MTEDARADALDEVLEADQGVEEPQEGEQPLVVASQIYPDTLPLIALPLRPVFPKTVAPLLLTRASQVAMVKAAIESQKRLVGLVLAKGDGQSEVSAEAPQQAEDVAPDELHEVGVVAQILKAQATPDGKEMHILVGGMDRIRIRRVLTRKPHTVAEVEYLHETKIDSDAELRAYALAVINSIKDLIQLSPLFKQELTMLVQQGSVEEPGRLADYAAYLTSAKGIELQRVLETLEVKPRLEKVLELLRRELEISRLQADIRGRIDERMGKQQREFFLREQLKAIKKELGLERDDKETEIERLQERLVGKTLSEEAQQRIDDEIDKIRLIEPSSPEYNVSRTYLDWLTALPWGVTTDAEVDMASARKVLADSHHGLEDVKERILEHIAAGILRGTFSGSIILLVGPPGVGKTSVGRAIAESLGRPFYRFSLGGMRDEAEIKGHRRTYIGAMPGKFIQALRVCKTADPVIMLDEIDKVGASFRGDPASALLEALDPEQCSDFLDHYLDVRFDLSKVMFLCTANQLDTIPGPLRDRMETIKLSGYLLEEKLEIARRFVLPKQLAAHGLDKRRFTITKSALRELIDGYARDPGVRTTEKLIKRIVRKAAVQLLEGDEPRVRVGRGDITRLVGRRIFRDDSPYAKPQPGVIMGLAWTTMGGDTLFIEATAVATGRGGFKQTGQLGKVMIESSEIAHTTARRLTQDMGEAKGFFDRNFVHLHVPAGATPKDGPSAGITMAAALYTLATGKPIKRGFAMTGELNLSGHVMPVGGIKEKVIAAKRAKVTNVVLPKDNEGDWELMPDYIKEGIEPHFVSTIRQVIKLCLS